MSFGSLRRKPNSSKTSLQGRGEQGRDLRTKALLRDLGTKLECQHRVFVRSGKTLWR